MRPCSILLLIKNGLILSSLHLVLLVFTLTYVTVTHHEIPYPTLLFLMLPYFTLPYLAGDSCLISPCITWPYLPCLVLPGLLPSLCLILLNLNCLYICLLSLFLPYITIIYQFCGLFYQMEARKHYHATWIPAATSLLLWTEPGMIGCSIYCFITQFHHGLIASLY